MEVNFISELPLSCWLLNEKYTMKKYIMEQRVTSGMKQSLSFQTLSFCKKLKK